MAIIVAVFLSSLLTALLTTPMVGWLGKRFHLVDYPSHRKIHTGDIPRIGGVALFVSYYMPFVVALFLPIPQSIGSEWNLMSVSLVLGSVVAFSVGLADDIRPLKAGVKFALQIVAAWIAYEGGIQVDLAKASSMIGWDLNWLHLPVTIFWFLLVINGINLIDGLDGLAAGVSFCVSLMLMVLGFLNGHFAVIIGLAALCGSTLGFLRYNFSPASIFMGDSGSYFLGYVLASWSILGSMSGNRSIMEQLVPVIALGLPFMDIFLATLRRFILGKRLFQADRHHIHHKLLELGFSQRRAVLWMYSATMSLGFCAILLVVFRGERSAIILSVLGIAAVWGIRKLGYLRYLGLEKILTYFKDIADEIGLRKGRRAFLERQIAINDAHSSDEMWERIVDACRLLKIDQAEIKFDGVCFEIPSEKRYEWKSCEPDAASCDMDHRVLSIELPLVDPQKRYGTLQLKKDLVVNPITHSTLRRIEHLRRTIVRKLRVLDEEAKRHGSSSTR